MKSKRNRESIHSPVILVTGGDSGIGLGIARKFAQEGDRVAICGLNRLRGAQALVRFRNFTIDADYFVADLRKEKQIQRLIRQTVEHFGRLDVLCNNAGIQKLASIEKASSSLWDDVMSVNLRGMFLSTKYVILHHEGHEVQE